MNKITSIAVWQLTVLLYLHRLGGNQCTDTHQHCPLIIFKVGVIKNYNKP